MNFKKSESGRSMVEMLGVLAIIGVLSVGGIAGYSLSMRRHRANQVLDIAAKYALAVYSQCYQKIMNGEPLEEGSTVTGCHTSTIDFDQTDVAPLPAGVVSFDHAAVEEGDGNSSDDPTVIEIKFNDQKLCQAVASISGVGCFDDRVYVPFKQN